MNRRAKDVLGVALCLAPLSQGTPPESLNTTGRVYVDKLRCFNLEVPVGWYVHPEEFEAMHYSSAFLSVNNQISGFRVSGMAALVRHGIREFRWPDSWAYQFPPGMVYVMFAYEGGPLAWPAYGPGQGPSFADALTELLQRPMPSRP